MKNIKKVIREEIDEFDWIRKISGEIPKDLIDDHKFLALVDLLGYEEVIGDLTEFDEDNLDSFTMPWKHYDIDVYRLYNGEEWAVGTHDEFDEALEEYYTSYFNDMSYSDIWGVENYVHMDEYYRHDFADDMANSYVEDLSDEDLLERAGFEDEYNTLSSEREDKESELIDLNEELYNLNMEDGDKERISELENLISELENTIERFDLEIANLTDRSKEIVHDIIYDEWYDCLGDPFDCLVRQHGLYSNIDDLIRYTGISIDGDAWIRDSVNSGDWGEIGTWDGTWDEVGDYVVARIG